MNKSDFESYIGKVICIDIVNRERPVGRLLEVTDGYVVLKTPYVCIPVPAGQGIQVQMLPYAAPLYDVKTLKVSLVHIVSRLDVQPQMEQAYIQQTSGLVTEKKSIIVP